MTAIATWLTEIYLDKLNELKGSNGDAYEALKEEFEGFLKDYEVPEPIKAILTLNRKTWTKQPRLI